MGYGYKCKCPKCGYMLTAFWGLGWQHTHIYPKILKKMAEGYWGNEGEQFVHNFPKGAVDIEYAAYQCETCNGYDVLPEMGLYEMADVALDATDLQVEHRAWEDWELVQPQLLKEKYKKMGQLSHTCIRCRGQMKKAEGFEDKLFAGLLKCPMCRESLECENVLQMKEPK